MNDLQASLMAVSEDIFDETSEGPRIASMESDAGEPRPARMAKPKVTNSAHRRFKLYVQDLLRDILVDKYGESRGVASFEYLINQNNRAMFTVGQAIQDEKAQMYMDLGEQIPSEAMYFHESYYAVWKRWIKRPIVAASSDSVAFLDICQRVGDSLGELRGITDRAPNSIPEAMVKSPRWRLGLVALRQAVRGLEEANRNLMDAQKMRILE